MNIIKKIIIDIFIILLLYEIHSNFAFINNDKKYIFTFWEPKEEIPGFLQLCIKTWEKFLVDYEIIVLDYNLTKLYIGEDLFSKIISKDMPIMVQSDAIRIAILNKFGGIWFDADTIVLNGEFIKCFQDFELAMIKNKTGFHYISFIYASKNSVIINEWLKKIIYNVHKFKNIINNRENTTNWKQSWKKVNVWYYLGNGIIDNLIRNFRGKHYFGIEWEKLGVFPEMKYFENTSLNIYQTYKSFYFTKGDPDIALNISKGLIFLHNSWTLSKYKNMSEEEFLSKDILLSKLFAKLLNLKV